MAWINPTHKEPNVRIPCFERLGVAAYKELTEQKAGWHWRKGTGIVTYILYYGPSKANKAFINGLQEGVTKFTGYDALGKQYDKDGQDISKIIERSQNAATTTPAVGLQQDPPVATTDEDESSTAATVPTTTTTASPTVALAVPNNNNETPLSAVTLGSDDHQPATTAATAPAPSLQARLDKLETLVHGPGGGGGGALLARVAQLEVAVYGASGQGSLLQRVTRLEQEMTA